MAWQSLVNVNLDTANNPGMCLAFAEDAVGAPHGLPTAKSACDAAWPQIKYSIEYNAAQNARLRAYRDIADPLFFSWQRNEGTEQAWLDAVQAVKDANPYPEAPVA